MKLLLQVSAALVFSVSSAYAAKPVGQDPYCSYLETLHGQQKVSLEGLERLENAKAGEAFSPIDRSEAEKDPTIKLAFNTLKLLATKTTLENAQACARELLERSKQTGRERGHKKEETKRTWKNASSSPRIVVNTYSNACGLTSKNEVVCWGKTPWHKPGDPDLEQVPAGLGPVRFLSISDKFACAVDMDWNLKCWGKVPTWVLETKADFRQVEALVFGKTHFCVTLPNKTVTCEGGDVGKYDKRNEYKQLDVPANLVQVRSLTAGPNGNCAIDINDVPQCWGDQYNQSKVREILPANIGTVRSFALMANLCAAVQSGGGIVIWGWGSPNLPKEIVDAISVAFTYDYSASIDVDGKVSCYGPTGAVECKPLQSIEPIHTIAMSRGHICGINLQGKAACWQPESLQRAEEGSLEPPLGGDLDELARQRALPSAHTEL